MFTNVWFANMWPSTDDPQCGHCCTCLASQTMTCRMATTMWQAVASHSCHRETFGHSVAISVVLTGNLSPVLFSMLVEALKEIEKQGSRNELRRHKHTRGYAYDNAIPSGNKEDTQN